MKKKTFKSLKINKKSISNLNSTQVVGGRNSYDGSCYENNYNMGCENAEHVPVDLYTSYYPTEEGGGVPSDCGRDY